MIYYVSMLDRERVKHIYACTTDEEVTTVEKNARLQGNMTQIRKSKGRNPIYPVGKYVTKSHSRQSAPHMYATYMGELIDFNIPLHDIIKFLRMFGAMGIRIDIHAKGLSQDNLYQIAEIIKGASASNLRISGNPASNVEYNIYREGF